MKYYNYWSNFEFNNFFEKILAKAKAQNLLADAAKGEMYLWVEENNEFDGYYSVELVTKEESVRLDALFQYKQEEEESDNVA